MNAAVRYQLLRHHERWEARLDGLVMDPAGVLELLALPAPEGDVSLAPPFAVGASGIAIDDCGHLLISDGDGGRIVMMLTACQQSYVLPPDDRASSFRSPTGIAVGDRWLYLAETGNARILRLRLPALEICGEITLGLQCPTALAIDRQRRLYVIDSGSPGVIRRILSDDLADTAFDRAMAVDVQIANPVSLAVGEDDLLYVSDANNRQVHVFDLNAVRQGVLAPGVLAMLPGALACGAGLLFVADGISGQIIVFDTVRRTRIGVVPRWRGAVAAMACTPSGDLYVKPGQGGRYERLRADRGCLATGVLEAGPFDAGMERDWERVKISADVPPGARITVQACVLATSLPTPPLEEWQTLPTLDCLLDRSAGPAKSKPGVARYLWLRVMLESLNTTSSPRLHQVEAHTVGVSYLEQLPRIYRRDDAPTRFLERLLALARASFSDWDDEYEAIARRFDPAIAPAEHLHWLANCMAFVPPQGLPPAALRSLITRLPDLYARRGTVSGMRDLAEIFTGIRIRIFEAYRERHLWQLGDTSALGFDTALPAASPDGWLVPGDLRTDASYAGLQGDYYSGVNFDRPVLHRIDHAIDFGSELADICSPLTIRWSGQLRAQYDETYSLHVQPRQGVRLWVAGYPLIDTWRDGAIPKTSATLPEPLEAGRWYPVLMEVRYRTGNSGVRLEWASRSQRRNIIGVQSLYSVLDERADLGNTEVPAGFIEIGNTVLGEAGPAPASDFGAALFSDFAHLFTVVAPAGDCCDAGKREALRALIEAEKPAHTDFNLCFAEADMSVGNRARLGVDSIVAGGPAPLRLEVARLGRDSVLASAYQEDSELPSRHAQVPRLGVNSIVGKEDI